MSIQDQAQSGSEDFGWYARYFWTGRGRCGQVGGGQRSGPLHKVRYHMFAKC